MESQGNSPSFSILSDSLLTTRISELATQQVPVGAFRTLGHLLAAEEVLDMLAANGIRDAEYLEIEGRARAYIASHPELLSAPWLRTGGAVYDLLSEAREARLCQAEPRDLSDRKVA